MLTCWHITLGYNCCLPTHIFIRLGTSFRTIAYSCSVYWIGNCWKLDKCYIGSISTRSKLLKNTSFERIITFISLKVGPLASFAGVISSLSVLLTFCHWKQLKKPYLALIKLLLIAASLFGMGTLPWQQNFAGLIGGLVFGTALTLALVPFVNLSKYNRKSKVSLIEIESGHRMI